MHSLVRLKVLISTCIPYWHNEEMNERIITVFFIKI